MNNIQLFLLITVTLLLRATAVFAEEPVNSTPDAGNGTALSSTETFENTSENDARKLVIVTESSTESLIESDKISTQSSVNCGNSSANATTNVNKNCKNVTGNAVLLTPVEIEVEYKHTRKASKKTLYIGWGVFAGMILLIALICLLCFCFGHCRQKYNQNLANKHETLHKSFEGRYSQSSVFAEHYKKESDEEDLDEYKPPAGSAYGPSMSGGWSIRNS